MRQFLEHLLRDPDILDKKIQHRTSTQLFSFTGRYKKYSKFFFVPDSVRINLQEITVPKGDDMSQLDTIMVYQITAYAKPGDKGQRDVAKEWEKIKKVWSKRFFDREEEDAGKDNGGQGKYLHLFLPQFSLSPLTIGYRNIPGDTIKPVLSITLRLKQQEDYVNLPGALNYF